MSHQTANVGKITFPPLSAHGAPWAVIGGQGGVSNILPYDPKYYTFLESLAQNIQI